MPSRRGGAGVPSSGMGAFGASCSTAPSGPSNVTSLLAMAASASATAGARRKVNRARSRPDAGPNPSRHRRTSTCTASAASPTCGGVVATTYEGRGPCAHAPELRVAACTTGANCFSAHHARGTGRPKRSASHASTSAVVARLGGEAEEVWNHGVDFVGRQPGELEAGVVQTRRPQQGHHRVLKRRVVVTGDGVQGEPQQLRLHDGLGGEGDVEVGRVEAGDAVPQREVRRGGFLRLDRHDAAHGVDDGRRLPRQEQLAGEGGAVQLPPRQRHRYGNGQGFGAQPSMPLVCCIITGAGQPGAGHATWPNPRACPTSWLMT